MELQRNQFLSILLALLISVSLFPATLGAFQSDVVVEAQTRLSVLGLYAGPVDSFKYENIREVLKVFQERNGLPGTGKLDKTTVDRLRKETSSLSQGIIKLGNESSKISAELEAVNKSLNTLNSKINDTSAESKTLVADKLIEGFNLEKSLSDWRTSIVQIIVGILTLGGVGNILAFSLSKKRLRDDIFETESKLEDLREKNMKYWR